jgi:DNA-binding transcriptional LysR family regulator
MQNTGGRLSGPTRLASCPPIIGSARFRQAYRSFGSWRVHCLACASHPRLKRGAQQARSELPPFSLINPDATLRNRSLPGASCETRFRTGRTAALYRVVIVRMRGHQPTLEYVRRRIAEGKASPRSSAASSASSPVRPLAISAARPKYEIQRQRALDSYRTIKVGLALLP